MSWGVTRILNLGSDISASAFKLKLTRHENVFGFGTVFREFAIGTQNIVKPHRYRVFFRPENARFEIG